MSYETVWTFTVWTFETARTRTTLNIEIDPYYEYDGDDEDGETQAKLKSGEYVAFDSVVRVEIDGRVVAEDHLGGSVYAADEVEEFWTAHRCADPKNRNCSIGTAMRGYPAVICHYFPEMVLNAVAQARKAVTGAPKLRAA